MSCHQNPLQLMEYAEGTLKEAEAALLEVHLSSCALCRSEVSSWKRLDLALRFFPIVQEPVGFSSAVMGQIAREQRLQLPAASLLRSLPSALLSTAFGSGMALLGLVIVLLNSFGVETLLDWVRESLVWLGLYLEVGSPFLLAAGWLLTGAFAVAVLALASSEGRRLMQPQVGGSRCRPV
jgi:anti-sigma factor RsiW